MHFWNTETPKKFNLVLNKENLLLNITLSSMEDAVLLYRTPI